MVMIVGAVRVAVSLLRGDNKTSELRVAHSRVIASVTHGSRSLAFLDVQGRVTGESTEVARAVDRLQQSQRLHRIGLAGVRGASRWICTGRRKWPHMARLAVLGGAVEVAQAEAAGIPIDRIVVFAVADLGLAAMECGLLWRGNE